MEVSFSLVLPDALYRELIEGCRECKCTPRQFALESHSLRKIARLRALSCL